MAGTPYPVHGNAPPPYAPPNQPFQTPVSKLDLKISCRNLLDLDVFSKSDPFVVVYMQSQNKKEWREIGRTETIMDNLNPDFVRSFTIDYFFEEQQMLKFEVYDWDSNSPNLSDQDFIGTLVTSLGAIVGENNGRIERQLQNQQYTRKSPGSIIIRAEEVCENKDEVTLHLCGKKLDKKDFFGKSDPFLEFHRCNEDNSYSVVHRTEVIKKTLNPNWATFKISAKNLCNGDYDRNLKVYCYDWERSGSHDLIGVFDVTLRDLQCYNQGRPSFYELIHPAKKRKSKRYKHSGTIHVQSCTVYEKPTFLEYIRGGMELNFVVAIDFTASNGNPSDANSLHYNSPNVPSQYVQVLQSVGAIIEDYDSDKLFPSFGFGAKLPPTWAVRHEFALNFNPQNPDCFGINGIIAAYYNSIANVQLYGPTNFSPVINSCARIARDTLHSSRPGSQYFVLLIITDGIISDMERTKEAIVKAATLPVSIIIVGVGKAEFDNMEELDGDEVRVSYRGRAAERDIVQFVPFRDYMTGNMYNPASGVRLAKDVLHELPDQVIEYMDKHKIKPNPPPAYS